MGVCAAGGATFSTIALASALRRVGAVPSHQHSVLPCALPQGALLQSYVAKGAYTDCFAVEIPARVSFADYVTAFYTSAAFRPERLVLWCIGKPSSDADVRRLANGSANAFAAWSVEGRAPDQLLLCDFLSRTRSWLMVEPTEGGTRFYFGSAVVPVGAGSGGGRLGFPFDVLLGFHRLYSRVLLRGAVGRLAAHTRKRSRT